jgi:hypothetical protein
MNENWKKMCTVQNIEDQYMSNEGILDILEIVIHVGDGIDASSENDRSTDTCEPG